MDATDNTFEHPSLVVVAVDTLVCLFVGFFILSFFVWLNSEVYVLQIIQLIILILSKCVCGFFFRKKKS